MPYVAYVARRALAPSHAAGSTYVLPIVFTELQRPSGNDLKVTTQTLSGAVETLYFGEIRAWSITLAPVRVQDAAIHYEFLRSTADGQVFTFDPYGSAGHNVQAMDVVRADQGFTEATFQREGLGGLTDWVTLGLQVREV